MHEIQAHLQHKDWDKNIKVVERNLNNATNQTTGYPPFVVLYGYKPYYTDSCLRELTHDSQDEYEHPRDIQEKVRNTIMQQQIETKERFNKKHSRGERLEVGQIVVMRRNTQHTGERTKTQFPHRGPLIVVQVLPSDTSCRK